MSVEKLPKVSAMCPVCHIRKGLRKNGTIYIHRETGFAYGYVCPGSEQFPDFNYTESLLKNARKKRGEDSCANPDVHKRHLWGWRESRAIRCPGIDEETG